MVTAMPDEAPDAASASDPDAEGAGPGGGRRLPELYLELPYIPDFLFDEVRFWFVPSRQEPRAVYHELTGRSAENWASYYSKKGWSFLHDAQATASADGPYTVAEGEVHLDVLAPGRFRAPRPVLRLEKGGGEIPIVSLEKRRPLNPWKPNYIRALEFIKRFEWPHPLPRRIHAAFWEIEECGEIAGSTSWINAEQVLLDSDSHAVRDTLREVFYNRPEDFPLGSQVYLRVLGRLGREGFSMLTELASHPISRKRCAVARTLGEPGQSRGVETLLVLLDDEDPDVRGAALRSLASVGVSEEEDPDGAVRSYLESPEAPYRVWAAAALFAGGDDEQRKHLVQILKEHRRPLADLGDLGDVLADLEFHDAVPFLIARLKDDRVEVAVDAAETLARMTGLHVELSVQESAEQRREAIRAYQKWWDEHKRERAGHGDRKRRRRKR